METILLALTLNLHKFYDWYSSLTPYDLSVLVLGFVAQMLFFARFFVQWIASERQKKSVVPVSFWFLSIIGGGLLFIYALLKRDPVFILGQGSGLFIYFRNLYLIYKHKNKNSGDTPALGEPSA